MNRKERRSQAHETKERAKTLPDRLTIIPRDEYPPMSRIPERAWVSKKYLVQLYSETSADYPGLARLTICRSTKGGHGTWVDGLRWDELQSIKRDIGYGEWYALEVYPRDYDLVNVSNMRHLWLLPVPLAIGWFEGGNR